MRSPRTYLGAFVALLMGATAAGQESEAPELDFLEYLGSWQETDEEWLIVAEWDDKDDEQRDKKRRRERKDDE